MRVVLLASIVVSLTACPTGNRAISARSSGSIAIAPDDTTLAVADADHDQVTMINGKTLKVLGSASVGSRPERVLIAEDGAIFVSNRGERTVMRLSPSGLAVEATGHVGAEPVGMAMSPDGTKLYVANSMSGTVSVLEPKSLGAVSELQVGGQPWAIAVRPDGHTAYVTDFNGGQLVALDLGTGVASRIGLTQPAGAGCPNNGGPSRTPAQAADVVISPDGDRAYVAHVQSRTTLNTTNLAFAVAPALSTLETATATVLREPTPDSLGAPANVDFPPVLLANNVSQECMTQHSGMDAPSSLVVDGSGEWIFVADHNSDAVAVVSASRKFDDGTNGIYALVRVGARPTGIAVSADLRTAYVHNALDYTVSVIQNRGHELLVTGTVGFAQSNLAPQVERGRRLFYSAVDPRMTQPELGGVSCSSCHPEGRTDGLNWTLPTSTGAWGSQVARNTKPLWGLADTAPYHWDGLVQDLPAFTTQEIGRMGGMGLVPDEVGALNAFLATVQMPDNPTRDLAPKASLDTGKRLFTERCASCHAGAAFTNGGQVTVGNERIDTPSLRGAFATPPYLHDGSVRSLRQAFSQPGALTAHDQRDLSSADLDALELWVRSL